MPVIHDPIALAAAQEALTERGVELADQAAALAKLLQDSLDQTATLAAQVHAEAERVYNAQAALDRDSNALDITAPNVLSDALRTLDRPAQALFHAARRGARDAARAIGESATQTIPLPQRNTSSYVR